MLKHSHFIDFGHSLYITIAVVVSCLEQFENYYRDRLEIRDGYQATSRLIARLQGAGVAPDILSTSNALFLQFRTDETGTSKGFLATYTSMYPSIARVHLLNKDKLGTARHK